MNRFKKVLFFADGSKGEKSALRNAMELAEHNEAPLTVLDIVAKIGTNDKKLTKSITKLQQAIVDERLKALNKLVKETLPKRKPPSVTARVIPGDKDFIEVIRTVVIEKHDLLIKAVDSSGVLSAVLFGQTDLHLMRQCPCPVWIIKSGAKRVSNMLAAVDLTSDEKSTVRLAGDVVKISAGIAEVESASLHVLAAWQDPTDASVKKLVNKSAHAQMLDAFKADIKKRFDALARKFALDQVHSHIVRGKPDDQITRYVNDYDIDLLVMGTLSRTGISGLLIGNTAERVLNQVNCSVLTLKPKGFKSPVK